MSKRNAIWPAAIVVVGSVLWIAFGALWGIGGAVATLVTSEVVERTLRQRRRTAKAATAPPR